MKKIFYFFFFLASATMTMESKYEPKTTSNVQSQFKIKTQEIKTKLENWKDAKNQPKTTKATLEKHEAAIQKAIQELKSSIINNNQFKYKNLKPSETARFLDTENSFLLKSIKNHFDAEKEKIETIFKLISSCPDPLSSNTIVDLPDQKIYIQDKDELIINPSYGINHNNYQQNIELAQANPQKLFLLLGVAKDILDQKATRNAYLQSNNAILETLLDKIQKILPKNQSQKMSSQKTLLFNMNDFPDFNYKDLMIKNYEQDINLYVESLLSSIKEWKSKKEAECASKEQELLNSIDSLEFHPLKLNTDSLKQLKIFGELTLQKEMQEKMKNMMAAFETTNNWNDHLLASNKNRNSLCKNKEDFSLLVQNLQNLNLSNDQNQDLENFLNCIQTPELKLQKGAEELADSMNRGAQIVHSMLLENQKAFSESIQTLDSEIYLIGSTFLKVESLKKIANQLEQMIRTYNQNSQKADLKSILKIVDA